MHGKKLPAHRRRVAISVTIAPKIARRIDRLAKSMGKTRSELVEQLIEDGLHETELTAKAITNPVIAQALLSSFGRADVLRAMTQAMRDELSDDQLKLFGDAMAGMTAVVSAGSVGQKHRQQQQQQQQQKGKGEK